ncbi:hypothetical protein DZG00_12875 [Clavibacter lycopersici]|uniref:Uncharacterized protein n=1 Tax=Clavibacter lycopersici TaxID=2301718 RepID=A0A399T1S8_9MICO|nr:hypothetical protein [Clavibacter lycopersici]RIJ48091.1 hypothetical protein DZG00_12875 [Clavibacter lycopersici]RIJ60433.1 hypothetical protein DZG02_10050 [Clavibacter lycopersici]
MTSTAPDRPQPLFRRIRRAWADAPVLRALVVAAVFFAWVTALDLGRVSEEPGTIVLRVVVAVLAGVAYVGARWIRRLNWPGSPREVEVSEAAEDGELPAGADPTQWQGALDRRRKEIRQEAWMVPLALVFVVGLAFLVRPGYGDVLPLPYVVLLAVLVPWSMWLIVSRGRRRDAVDALLIPLQEQVRADDARRAGWAPPSPDDSIPPAAG